MSCERWEPDKKNYVYPDCLSCLYRATYPKCPEFIRKIIPFKSKCPYDNETCQPVRENLGCFTCDWLPENYWDDES